MLELLGMVYFHFFCPIGLIHQRMACATKMRTHNVMTLSAHPSSIGASAKAKVMSQHNSAVNCTTADAGLIASGFAQLRD
jgi:hypothetical protein